MTTKINIPSLAATAIITSVTFTAAAQEKKTEAGKIIQKTGKAAKSVGNKTADVAVKGSAKVVDQTYKGKSDSDQTKELI